MTAPIIKERAACDLLQSVNNGLELVIESLEWVVKQKNELIRRLKERSISKEEFEGDMAEIRELEQHIREVSQQLAVSEKKAIKVLENNENND